MEGVVSEELRQRIERILAFPVEGGAGGQGEHLPETPPTPSTRIEATRTPAGGLLQDYLDQLDPEEEEELMFQGSESEENEDDDDLLYDPEKETYTTPYLLFLQHAKSRRRDFATQPADLTDDLAQNGEASSFRDDEEGGREGARGRTGHRTISSVVETTRTTTSADPTTLKDDQELTETGGGGDSLAVPAGATTAPFVPSVKALRNEKEEDPASGGSQEEEEEEEEDEEEEEENGVAGEEGTKEGKTKESKKKKSTKKKKSKKKKKKKGANEANGGDEKGDKDDEGADDTAEETVRKNEEKLRKSVALALFRDFAKTVFAKNQPGFKLFDGFEELPEGSKDSDEARN
ncbi:histone acetyltransferase KAT6B-like [Penaeus indicus]|uniref:histone acetyltransferase KAT6B-like n=1 Tax=Penaeus indicus TaxID=29960 RepID=UPI00300C38EB